MKYIKEFQLLILRALANHCPVDLVNPKGLHLCPSSNPPSVLGGIPLSSQPELVQELFALFGLAPPGSAFFISVSVHTQAI